MQELELRALIEDVRTGQLPRRSFIQRMVGLGLTAPMASMMLMHAGVAQAQPAPVYKPTKRGGGGALKVLWWQGADAAAAALRQRHQGPGRLAHLLRAARRLGQRRQPGADPRRRDPDARRTAACSTAARSSRWQPEEGRDLARRQAVHRRRRRLHLGIRARPGDRRGHDRASTRTSPSPRSTTHTVLRLVQEADAVLGHGLRRRRGHDHPEAPVRPVRRRQVARRADQPEAGRHRARTRSSTSSRATSSAARSTTNYHMPNRPLLRHDRDEGRRRRDLGGARRAADRRVRLRLEPAGRGRGAQAHGGRRQGQGAHRARRRHRVHPAQHHRPVERGRRRARQRQEQALRVQRPEGARGDGAAAATRRASRSSSTAAPASRPPTS